jgi:hypothetical protein
MPERPSTKSQRRYRELAFRESDGVSVRLHLDSLEDEVFVRVQDRRDGDDFTLNPAKHEALSAFHHPYAHRPFERLGARTTAGGVR